MSLGTFDELLGKVGLLIAKADSVMRLAIGPAQRLAICLYGKDNFRMFTLAVDFVL